jgi:hypothetical protein
MAVRSEEIIGHDVVEPIFALRLTDGPVQERPCLVLIRNQILILAMPHEPTGGIAA